MENASRALVIAGGVLLSLIIIGVVMFAYRGITSLQKEKDISLEKLASYALLKAKYIYENKNKYYEELESKNELDLYTKLELPVTYVLSDMEYVGIYVSNDILNDMGKISLMKYKNLFMI